MDKKITNCTACNAEIFFVQSKAGKWTPVNAEIEDSDGKNILWIDEITGFKKLPEGRKGHISHFATCPKAAEFRRG